MTRKDYIRLAGALKWTRPSNPVCPFRNAALVLEYQTKIWRDTVVSVADALAEDNSRFDRNRFYQAAGLGPE